MTPYLQTLTGTAYDLERPEPDSIALPWVAGSLARLCRFTGHTRKHYSVAQHCVLGTRVLRDMGATEGVQRYFLLHDAHESVTGDVASPIKRAVGPAWTAFEELHRLAFAARFHLGREVPAAVKGMDVRMLLTERDQCLAALRPGERADRWPPGEPLDLKIWPWAADVAETEYLIEAGRLGVW